MPILKFTIYSLDLPKISIYQIPKGMNEALVSDILKNGGTTLMVIKAEDLKKAICETISETRRQMESEIAMNESETLLTGQQVQEKLNVSRTTLWNWRKDGYLVPIEIGGKYRYKLSDINKILHSSRIKRKNDWLNPR